MVLQRLLTVNALFLSVYEAILRRSALSLANSCSIGFKSGLYAGIKWDRPASLNGFLDSIDFVNTDVVHEHNVAPRQRRSEKLFRIGLEHLAGHRSFEHEGRGDAIVA